MMPKIYLLKCLSLITTLSLIATVSFANTIIPVPAQPQQAAAIVPGTPSIDAKSYLLMDVNSGKILAEKNADMRLAPASLTKLMSLYVIFGALKNNSIHLDDKVRISTKAWKTGGSRMFIKAGDEVSVKDLLQGIVVASGNDATVAMAEYVAGTEEAFTSIMNTQAKNLGMNDSRFLDSTGLPNPNHYSTARDLAKLTQALQQQFPEEYKLFSEKSFSYNNIHQTNRNRLLWHYQYADGLKTGHTDDAGFCLVSSANKDNMRLVSVIMGAPSDQARTEDSIRLLTYGYRFFETHKLHPAGTRVGMARVWKGTHKATALGLNNDLYVTLPVGQYPNITENMIVGQLNAPLVQGQTYGTLNILLNGQILASQPLVALQNNPKGGMWRIAEDTMSYGYQKLFSHSDEKPNHG